MKNISTLLHGIAFLCLLHVLYSMNDPKVHDVLEMHDTNPIFGEKVENVDLNMQQLDIRIKQKCSQTFFKFLKSFCWHKRIFNAENPNFQEKMDLLKSMLSEPDYTNDSETGDSTNPTDDDNMISEIKNHDEIIYDMMSMILKHRTDLVKMNDLSSMIDYIDAKKEMVFNHKDLNHKRSLINLWEKKTSYECVACHMVPFNPRKCEKSYSETKPEKPHYHCEICHKERLTHPGNKYQHDCLMGCEVPREKYIDMELQKKLEHYFKEECERVKSGIPPEINQTACEKLSDQMKLFRDVTCKCCEQQNPDNLSKCQECAGCLAWYSIWVGLMGCCGSLPILSCGPSGVCCTCIPKGECVLISCLFSGVCGGTYSLCGVVNMMKFGQENHNEGCKKICPGCMFLKFD